MTSAQTNAISKPLLETAIAQIDARLAIDPHNVSLEYDRAQIHELLGRKNDAMHGYVAVLAREPEHVEALNALGLLFMAAGARETARTLLSGAVLHGPLHAVAHANLAYLYLLDKHLTGARALYEHALRLDPELAIAHHGLAELLAQVGDTAGAAEHRSLGLRFRPITIHRFTGEGRPVHILALGTAAIGNVVTDAYFDSRVFLVASLIVEHDDPTVPLPPHDIVFNVIGEGDLCAGPLAIAAAIVLRTDAPVINHPDAVGKTSRAANAARLRRLDGVTAPNIVPIERAVLTGPSAQAVLAGHGFAFPLLVRSPGYHTGDHFVKVDRFSELAQAIAPLPGNALLVIEFLDVRDAAGDCRKYRVIIVNGTIYPLHVAISRRWKVHYFSADMADDAEHRAEDGAFLTDMRGTLGARAVAALERVRDLLELDYGGIDFAVDASGDLIVFEANASMIVPLPGPQAIWDYRRAPVARIHAAVRDMLVTRCGVAFRSLPADGINIDEPLRLS